MHTLLLYHIFLTTCFFLTRVILILITWCWIYLQKVVFNITKTLDDQNQSSSNSTPVNKLEKPNTHLLMLFGKPRNLHSQFAPFFILVSKILRYICFQNWQQPLLHSKWPGKKVARVFYNRTITFSYGSWLQWPTLGQSSLTHLLNFWHKSQWKSYNKVGS